MKGNSLVRDGARARESGFSLPEMLVAMLLLSIISAIVFEVYVGTMRASLFLESHTDMSVNSQRVANNLRREIVQTRTIFENDTDGQAYLAAFAVPTEFPILTDSKLPLIDPDGVLEPDTVGNERSGNILALVRQLPPIELTVDHDGDATTTPADTDGDGTDDVPTAEITLLSDRYQFKLYYQSENTSRVFRPSPGVTVDHFIDLIEFESGIYADYFQLSGLAAGGQTDMAKELFAAGITTAWNPGQPLASAFYTLSSEGAITLMSTPAIAPSRVASMYPQFAGGAISGSVTYTLAPQTENPLQPHHPVPLYAIADDEFPGGFEVLIVGQTGGRKVHVRQVLMASYANKLNTVATSITAATAEF